MNRKDKWRPEFHFTAPSGWINDPNGLVYFQNKYHLFYQHNPHGCDWGSMHWGHATSEDLVHWDHLPIALFPDQPYDQHKEGGCFSGSTLVYKDEMWIFYTGAVKHGTEKWQTQCLVKSKDGINFEKYANNPVIDEIQGFGRLEDCRDPKIFEYEGTFYMVLGASIGGANNNGDGRVLLLSSDNLIDWKFCSELFKSQGKFGTMCECPDFFKLGDKWVLTFSPLDHPKYYQTIYCVGTMDFKTFQYKVEKVGRLDYGADYYAAHSFLDSRGSRVLFAWQNGWLCMPWCEDFGPTSAENWRGALSIPRVIKIDGEQNLYFKPVEEIESVFDDEIIIDHLNITPEKVYIEPENPYSFRLKMLIDFKKSTSKNVILGIRGADEKAYTLTFDYINDLIIFNRDQNDKYSSGQFICPMDTSSGIADIELFVDYSSVELFVNGGKYTMTNNMYPDLDQVKCWFRTPYKEAVISHISIKSIGENR